MADSELIGKVEALLREVAAAHHRAFAEVDGDEPEWPLWYAERLQPQLSALLGRDLTRSGLTYWLVRVEKARLREGPLLEWPAYYAQDLLAAPDDLTI
jgi:hypothetical protein